MGPESCIFLLQINFAFELQKTCNQRAEKGRISEATATDSIFAFFLGIYIFLECIFYNCQMLHHLIARVNYLTFCLWASFFQFYFNTFSRKHFGNPDFFASIYRLNKKFLHLFPGLTERPILAGKYRVFKQTPVPKNWKLYQ